jgi:hypothetical protein
VTSILGLPARPLFAHVPIVLIPLGLLGAVAMCRPALRARIGWITVGLVVVAGLATQLAISAGESLEDYVRETRLVETHTEMGESIRPWVLAMFVALLVVMVVDRLRARRAPTSSAAAAAEAPDAAESGTTDPQTRRLRIVGTVALVLGLVFSVGATVTVIRIGHSGAKAVWNDTQQRIDRGVEVGGGEGGERGERDD